MKRIADAIGRRAARRWPEPASLFRLDHIPSLNEKNSPLRQRVNAEDNNEANTLFLSINPAISSFKDMPFFNALIAATLQSRLSYLPTKCMLTFPSSWQHPS